MVYVSAPEVSKTPDNFTELAVAVGRIEEGQKYVVKTIDEMKDGIDDLRKTVSEHSTDIADLKRKQKDAEDDADKKEARKTPWTAIVALLLAVISTIAQFLGF